MRGEVLYFDAERGTGFVSGADGNRYVFERGAIQGGGAPSKGTRVEFEADGGNARRIVLIDRPAPGPAPAPALRIPDIRAGSAGADTGIFGYFRRAFYGGYANFRGRARRKEYWSFALVSLLLLMAVSVAAVMVDAALGNIESEVPVITAAVVSVLGLALVIPGLAVTVRRQHDIGLSGWFILVALIPTIGNLILLVFALIPSQMHDNRWGPVPEGVR